MGFWESFSMQLDPNSQRDQNPWEFPGWEFSASISPSFSKLPQAPRIPRIPGIPSLTDGLFQRLVGDLLGRGSLQGRKNGIRFQEKPGIPGGNSTATIPRLCFCCFSIKIWDIFPKNWIFSKGIQGKSGFPVGNLTEIMELCGNFGSFPT